MAKQRRACDACYKRKIQCDLSGPGSRCNWCTHHDGPCTFNRVRGRKKNTESRSNTLRKDIAQRIGRIEDAIAIGAGLSGATEKTQTDAASTSSDQNPALGGAAGNRRDLKPDAQGSKCHVSPLLGSVSSGGLGKVYFGGCYLGAIDSNTMPSLSAEGRRWIFSATREWPTLPSFNDPDNPGQRQSFASSTSTPRHGGHLEQHAELPTRWVVESLLGQFLESDLSHIFPVVDPILFRDTLTQVYGPDSEAHVSDVASAKSCILAFVSFAGRHFTGTKEASYIDTDACNYFGGESSDQARQIRKTADVLSNGMKMLYHTASGRLQASSMCHGIACRIIFVLGGHTAVASPPHREPTIRDRQILQLRNMFWLVYIIDKEISLRTGQPPILQDEFCDLSLPHDYLGPHYTRAATDAHEIGATTPPSLPGDIRLSILKSRTCRLLYSFDATRKSDVELLRSIRELDEELESWRTSIPSEFAPVLSTKFKHSTWDLEKQGIVGGMRQMMLNLEYHHLRTMIHSASGRCMKPLDGTNQMRVSGLQSSLELSVEASRATLTHLSTATHKLPAEAFWFLIFYPMSALMTLFFNILRDPLNKEAEKDIELLGSVGTLIRSVSARHSLESHDSARVEALDQFIKELCRLGECAIVRVQSNERSCIK